MPGSGLLTESSLPCHPPTPLQLSQVLLSALNQDLIQFTLKPGVQVNVYATRMSPGQSATSVARLHLERHAVHFGVGKRGGGGLSQPSELFLKWRRRSQTPRFQKCANKNTKSPLSHPCTIFYFFIFPETVNILTFSSLFRASDPKK